MFNSFVIVLVFSGIFSFVNAKYLKLSSTIGLMLQALFMSLVLFAVKYFSPDLFKMIPSFERDIHFREFLLHIVLSFLLFAGAMHIDIHELKKQRKAKSA